MSAVGGYVLRDPSNDEDVYPDAASAREAASELASDDPGAPPLAVFALTRVEESGR